MKISTRAPLPDLLIIANAIESEKLALSDLQNLYTVCNTLNADYKYSLLNRDNLMQPIHMHLSQKQNTLFRIFFAFLKYILNLATFGKKDDPES